MGSEDWYRGPDWSAETRELFEKKIARARRQKAAYLWIKADGIAAEHPDDAEALFERSLACNDEFETARALNARANARAKRGDVSATLDDLALAARTERDKVKGLMSPARWEYAALVATGRHRDRYDEALKLMGWPISDMSFAGQVALAFIHHDRGNGIRARRAAKKALERATIKGEQAPGVPLPDVPAFPNPLYDRLLVIAGLWDDAELGPPPPVWPES
ncbi:hypothetical protein [Croceicoccus naphthovorans]|uniref:hypothetical protein n=1 Tax=Croceicoccus naphthovorans TaxID=1348774 RepID=UPI00069F5867|nr:hypothetical protein [Croceicoccus naphthovorans]MBB3991285.1 hypothetical protein [Croceicoccus naphthovorans]